MGGFVNLLRGLVVLLLRAFLKFRYWLLAVLLFVLLAVGAQRSGAVSTLTGWIELGAGFLVIAALYSLIDRALADGKSPFAWNLKEPERIRKIAELISNCHSSLVIVSGNFYSVVFDSPSVLAALRKLPQSVTIELYMTQSAVDKNSTGFRDWMASRNLSVEQLECPIRHRIIVDGRHARIEFRSTGLLFDWKKRQRPAMLVYAEPEVAARLRTQIDEARPG